MKAQYPTFSRQDKYIAALTGSYIQKYPEFSIEQIRCYAYEMTGVITRQINEVESYEGQMLRINTLQSLKNLSEVVTQSSTIFRLFIYLGKKDADWMEEIVRDDLKARDIPFPEVHKKRYLKFISDITAKIIDDICDSTKAKMVASKSSKGRPVGSKSSRSEEKPKSFVERVGRDHKPVKEGRSSFSDKESKKRARVHFVDESLPSKEDRDCYRLHI